MALYVIGDLHLSLTANKPMDVFGRDWDNHVERLLDGFGCVGTDDTVVLLGDLSWGASFEESEADFKFIDSLPGHKIIVKGNHDYWWATVTGMHRRLDALGLKPVRFLHNTAYAADGLILCGTRGWFYEEDRATNHDGKVFARELGRLRTSLERGAELSRETGDRLACFLHYPPLYEGYRCDEIVDMLNEFGVKRCWYGHLHGAGRERAIEGVYKGIEYTLVSADHLGFRPHRII